MTAARPRSLSVVIPTYRREQVLIDTVAALLALSPPPGEILVVDQSPSHGPAITKALNTWSEAELVRWIGLPDPSITHAMNIGLVQAAGEIVLFVDDDIVPGASLVSAHLQAHNEKGVQFVAGQVLQPGESAVEVGEGDFRFHCNSRRWVDEFMGCNFSVRRAAALQIGGFDENFVHAAYRFEAEFSNRIAVAGKKILFEPEASIRHLKAPAGGTRAFGAHLTTLRPSHSVGAYYYLLRAQNVPHRFRGVVCRLYRSIRTRHHLKHPWWIPGTLVAELLGLAWAAILLARGPRLLGHSATVGRSHD